MTSPRHLLSIVPPYSIKGPPLTAATLLGFLKANGRDDVGFLDLRLGTSNVYAPTYVTTGAAGETYAMDIPDLPLVLSALARPGESLVDAWRPDSPAIANYCQERGIDVGFLCRYLTSLTIYLERSLARLSDLSFIGFSVWTSNYLSTLIACAIVRRRFPRATIVLGGPQVTESVGAARLALASGLADRIVRGEGEQALLELLEAHGDERPSLPADLDEAILQRALLRVKSKPLPDFEKIDVDAYQFRADQRTIPFELSRGCTDKCSFCSEWVFWRKFRSDDPLRVVAQLGELSRRYGATDIYFVDSLLNGVPARLETFAEELLRRDLNLTWGGFMRASMELDKARLFKSAGLRRVFVGIESMSDETLQLMNKRRTQADNIRALEAFLGAGLEAVDCGLIPGFPGDTPERFLATLRELVRLRKTHAQLSIKIEPFSVTPNQPIFQRLAEFGLERRAWPQQTLDLAPNYATITEQLVHSVTGENQGQARADATRLAYSLVRGEESDGGRSYDPFAYSRHEDVVDTAVDERVVIVRDDTALWYALRAKTAEGAKRTILASSQEVQALRGALAGASTDEERRLTIHASFAELADLHVRSGAPRATWPSELRAAKPGQLAVHPGLLVRYSGDPDIGLILLRDLDGSTALTCDESLTPLFAATAPSPEETWQSTLQGLLRGASAAALNTYAVGLRRAGCFIETGARDLPSEPTPEPTSEPTEPPSTAATSGLVQLSRTRRRADT